jgi:tetratricopeptide (TPR) repeat protein
MILTIPTRHMNSAMNSIKYACSLNNQGVDLLVSGDSLSAMKSLWRACKLLKQAANEVETTSCCGMTLSSEEATLPFCESPATVPGLEGVEFYFYNHGIMITDTSNGESEEMISLYYAIVLFNWALAYHRQGRLGCEKSLKKASQLYSIAVQLLHAATMTDDMAASILTLLALNNKAQIHYDQCEYIQSVDCMEKISQIMGGVHGVRSTLNPEDVEGLMLNVMLLDVPTAAHAA